MEAILKKKLTLPNYLTASAKDLIIKVNFKFKLMYNYIF